MLGHLTLHKYGGAQRINAAGQVEGGGGAGLFSQQGRLVGHGDGMKINHTKKCVVAVLEVHPIADGP